MEIPIHHVGLLFPRSSVSKTDLRLCNSVGVIDSGYRGEVIVKFDKQGNNCYEPGDRVAQLLLVPIPSINFVEVIKTQIEALGLWFFRKINYLLYDREKRKKR